jgi:hypothetical protein
MFHNSGSIAAQGDYFEGDPSHSVVSGYGNICSKVIM